jgi:hypothetical protein
LKLVVRLQVKTATRTRVHTQAHLPLLIPVWHVITVMVMLRSLRLMVHIS